MKSILTQRPKKSDEDDSTSVSPVDIATLTVPDATAADFVLEANARIIDQLLECNIGSLNTEDHSSAPRVEGILDLTTAASLLTGITEEEFVNLLHANEDAAAGSSPGYQDDDDEERERLVDDMDNATAFVSVSPDAFVQSFQDIGVTSGRKSVTQSSFTSSIQTTLNNEAFLLNIPGHGANEKNQNYGGITQHATKENFVLALPEVVGTSTSSFRTSAVTDAFVEEGVLAPLPTDITNVELHVSTINIPSELVGAGTSREVHLDLVVDRKVPLIAYGILISGLFALSSIGAALDLQHGDVTPEMKIFWRLSSTSILFLWPATKSGIDCSGLSRIEIFVVLPLAAMNYAIMNTAFAASLELTSLVNAFILSNLASLIIIFAKLITGVSVPALEGIGTLIGLSGAAICAMAPSEVNDDDMDGSRNMIGNLLAVFASIATSIYLTAAKNLRPKIDLFLFMFLIFVLASMFQLMYIVFSGQSYEISANDDIGIFGWIAFRKDRLFLELYIAIICNGVGTTGYIAIMKYFDPVVVAMVMLMEPCIALFQGIAVGVTTLPGWITWLGNAIVISGSMLVIWSGSKKTETIDATDALLQAENELVKSLNCSIKVRGSRIMKSPLVRRDRGISEDTEFIPVRGQFTTSGSMGPKK